MDMLTNHEHIHTYKLADRNGGNYFLSFSCVPHLKKPFII